MRRFRWLGVAALTASLCFWCVAEASAYNVPYRGYHAVVASGSSWTGVRVKMEIRAGDISTADANAGLYIAQLLEINDSDITGDLYVAAGVIRRDNSQGNEVTQFCWRNADTTGMFWHYVQRDYLNPDDYTGTQQYVSIVNGDNTNDWMVYIAGEEAMDNSGDWIAQAAFDHADNYRVGLEFKAASGEYGTNANPSNNVDLSRSLDNGATWGYPNASYAQDGLQNDPAGKTHLGWTTRPSSCWIYRHS